MRLKLLSPGEMNESQRQTYDESIAGKRGKPPAPMMAWLNSPDMARHATRLGEVLRYDTIFPAKLSEIAILVTARHWTAHYEWYAHKRLALAGGMKPDIIDAIRDRRTPEFDDPKGKMIYDVAKSLHEGHGVEKGLYDEAVKLLGERGVVEVIGLCGYYTLVSMTLNTFEFEPARGRGAGALIVSRMETMGFGIGAVALFRGSPYVGVVNGAATCRRTKPSPPAPGSATFTSRSPISTARWASIAVCSASS